MGKAFPTRPFNFPSLYQSLPYLPTSPRQHSHPSSRDQAPRPSRVALGPENRVAPVRSSRINSDRLSVGRRNIAFRYIVAGAPEGLPP